MRRLTEEQRAFRARWGEAEPVWRRTYGSLERGSSGRREMAEQLARLFGCHTETARSILARGLEATREAKRNWGATDGSGRATDEAIMSAPRRPRGCSPQRWRIELRRRRGGWGDGIEIDPEGQYRVR